MARLATLIVLAIVVMVAVEFTPESRKRGHYRVGSNGTLHAVSVEDWEDGDRIRYISGAHSLDFLVEMQAGRIRATLVH